MPLLLVNKYNRGLLRDANSEDDPGWTLISTMRIENEPYYQPTVIVNVCGFV